MKYNLKIPQESKQAYDYLAKLLIEERLVEIKKVSPRRSLNQNNYLHLILSAFGAHFGYSLEESKQVYKQVNSEMYFYTKEIRGKTMKFVRSSSDLTKEDMASTIDKFMRVSAEAGYTLPLATDAEALQRLENYIEENKFYL